MRFNEKCYELYEFLKSIPDAREVELVAFVKKTDSSSIYLRLVSEVETDEAVSNKQGSTICF